MKNSRRKSKLIVAILIIPIFVIVLSASICSAQGIIITLENTGPSPITDAGLGFDLKPPLDPLGKFAVDVRDFQIGVIPISMDNPLAPGGTACIGPISHLSIRDYVEYEGAQSFGNGFTENFPGSLQLIPNVTTLPFDYTVSGVQGGRIAGVFRFFSSVPDSCKTGYAPPFGTMRINYGAALTTSPSAALSLSCYATVGYTCQKMQFSNDNTIWSAPEPYTKDKTWILLPGDGEKTIYVRFEDNIGNWSDAYSDKITLSTPTLTQIRSFPIPAFPEPGGYARGLAFGDGKLFTINYYYDRPCPCPADSARAKIYVLDPANGNILNSFSVPPDTKDIASDGVNLYVNKNATADILKLDSTTGSILATIHPSDASIGGEGNSYIWGITYLNGEICEAARTQNCDGISIVGLNAQDGSFVGCFTASPGHYPDPQELDSTGINFLYGRWVRDANRGGPLFWTVSTIFQGGSLLKSDIVRFSQTDNVPHIFETWGDNQLFVADKQSNQILVFQFPSTIGVAPASLDFAKVIVGGASIPQAVTISNTGSTNLVIKSIETTGTDNAMFSVATGGPNPCSSLTPTISPGQNCTVGVTFSPTSIFEKTAILSVLSDAPDVNPVNVSLNGTGAITPNGGDVIPSGSTYAIHWGEPSNAVKFDLNYSINNGSSWKTVARKVIGTSYDWHVPIRLDNKTNCLFKIMGFDSSGKGAGEEVSGFPFAIEVVKATSPAGGEILKSGNTQTIVWRTNGTMRPVASAKLFYSINGGRSWKTIETVRGNPGSYDWTVPNVSSSSCKVKVVLKDAGGAIVGNNVSDGFFTIQP